MASVFSLTSALATNSVSGLSTTDSCRFMRVFEAKEELSSGGAVTYRRVKNEVVSGCDYLDKDVWVSDCVSSICFAVQVNETSMSQPL